jgi:uncharacterized membrane protein YciS (DUF1049 family)
MMDFTYLLILDAVVLLIATIILSYFFIRDILKEKKNSKKDIKKTKKNKSVKS